MKVVKNIEFHTDAEIVEMLKESSDALSFLYKKHKDYCINFMKAMYDDTDAIKDIFQDALIVLYENVNKPEFKLSCSIQTYLNSICRNQVLIRLTHSKKYDVRSAVANEEYLENITDWFDDTKLVDNERVTVLKDVFIEMKTSEQKCYDILVRFFYFNQTMDKIAEALGYTNADNAKNQKYRCQEKLKKEMFKRLKY